MLGPLSGRTPSLHGLPPLRRQAAQARLQPFRQVPGSCQALGHKRLSHREPLRPCMLRLGGGPVGAGPRAPDRSMKSTTPARPHVHSWGVGLQAAGRQAGLSGRVRACSSA